MARLPRLALSGLPHLVLLRGLEDQPTAVDDEDREQCLQALATAAQTHRLAIHGYALRTGDLRLLATPADEHALGRTMQDFGRRYVARFNRRHRRRGPLWDGRFRSAVVEPGSLALQALVWIESESMHTDSHGSSAVHAWSSAAAHLGQRADPLLSTLAAYWHLGNTPFDRELAYARLLADGVASPQSRRFDEACRKGWPIGDAGFLASLSQRTSRPLQPRRPGRPRRTAG